MGSFSLNFIEALVGIGIPRDRAESLSALLKLDIDERYSLHAQVLATKLDLRDLELKIMRELANTNQQLNQTRLDLTSMISATNERIAESNERIAESKTDLIKWTLGAMIALAGLMFAAVKLSI